MYHTHIHTHNIHTHTHTDMVPWHKADSQSIHWGLDLARTTSAAHCNICICIYIYTYSYAYQFTAGPTWFIMSCVMWCEVWCHVMHLISSCHDGCEVWWCHVMRGMMMSCDTPHTTMPCDAWCDTPHIIMSCDASMRIRCRAMRGIPLYHTPHDMSCDPRYHTPHNMSCDATIRATFLWNFASRV